MTASAEVTTVGFRAVPMLPGPNQLMIALDETAVSVQLNSRPVPGLCLGSISVVGMWHLGEGSESVSNR